MLGGNAPESLVPIPLDVPELEVAGPTPWRDDRYALIRPLGRGSFGDVYLAHDTIRGHAVALKMVRGLPDDARQRLRREFRLLKDFDHPGIVELFELHIDEDQCFFTMEYVHGANLGEALAAAPPDERRARARTLLGLLVDAVLTLHAAGVVHRDLKPSNLIVTPEGRLVVLDAGLARSVDSSSGSGFAGTVAYMSPEQARGTLAGPPSDVYALGTIAYELFTGTLPFEAEPFALIHLKCTVAPPPIAERCPELPPRDATLVDRMLALAPAERPRADELARWAIELGAGDRGARSGRAGADTKFVGRLRDMARLDGWLDSVGGHCEFATIVGPSGIGKSALVAEWLVRLGPRADTLVLVGHCFQREAVPFNGFDEVLGTVERTLAPLVGDGALPREVIEAIARVPGWAHLARRAGAHDDAAMPPDPIENRRATARAIVRVLRHVVGERRLVLWVDDAQWGPIETAFLLAEMSRATWTAGALVVLTHRPLTVGDGSCVTVLGDVVALTRTLTLGPLDAAEARALIEANAGTSIDARAAERLVADGMGHPLLLTQAMRFLGGIEGPSEKRLEDLLRARVAAFPESAQRLLRVACIARAPISERCATVAADAGDGDARRLIAEGLARRTGATGHRIVPFHDKLRSVVLASLSPDELRGASLRIADALAGDPDAAPETLIDYLVAGGERRSAFALVSEAAARMDRDFAFARSAELCRLALELATEFADERIQDARLALGEALVNCGRCHEAAQVFLEAAAHAGQDEAADALRGRAALELMRGGYIADGLELARRTFKRLGIKLSRSSLRALPTIVVDRLRLWRRGYRYELRGDRFLSDEVLTRIDWCLHVGTVLPLVDTLRGFQVHNQGLRWALDAGEPSRLARVLAMEVGYRNALHRGSDIEAGAAALLRSAETLAAGTGDPMARAVVEIMRASARWSIGDWRGCVAAANEGVRILRGQCRAASWEVNFATSHMLDALVWLAEFELHERTFRAEIEDAVARGDRYAQLMYVVRDSLMNATVRDTLEAAEARVAELRAHATPAGFDDRGFQVEHLAELFERNHFALYRGQGDVAYSLFVAAWRGIRASQLMRLKAFRIEVRSGRGRAAVLAAAQLGPGRRRRALIKEAAQLGRRIEAEPPEARTLVLSCPLVAGALHLQGNDAAARARLERGITDAARMHMVAHEQAFRWALAGLVGGEAGARDGAAALDALSGRGVRRPERYAAMLIPGFAEAVKR